MPRALPDLIKFQKKADAKGNLFLINERNHSYNVTTKAYNRTDVQGEASNH